MSSFAEGHAYPARARDKVEAITISRSAVRVEKSGPVWTVIHSRPEERNAMDPASADALAAAFQSFDAHSATVVAVLWGEGRAFCAGWNLEYSTSLQRDRPLAVLHLPTYTDIH